MANKKADKQVHSPPDGSALASQDRLRLFLECVRDYAIILLDRDGCVAEWSAGAEGIFGYPEAEVIGQPFTIFFPPEEQARAQQELRRAALGRAEEVGWRVRKDGTRFWAAGTRAPLRDAQGNVIGFGKVIRDLTATKQLEDQLRVVEERFRLFMENVKEYAVFMLDPEGRVVDWNLGAEHVLGYGEEILGQPFAIFFPPDDRSSGVPEQELRRALLETGRSSDDRWHVRKDGTYFWATGNISALRDEQGTLKGFTKVLRDSTERKRLEEELQKRNEALQEADRNKDEFLAVLAHELRNPLAPVFSALSILEQDNLPDDTRRHAREIIDRQVRQLSRLVDELLDVSRITRGKIQLKKKPVDLQAIINSAVETCRPLIDAHKHELTVVVPPEPIWLEGDPTRIEQVIVNLLNNSAKYSKDASRITLTAELAGDKTVLAVQDTGIGIAPELLPHIFDLFTQADRSLERSQGGLGIGLTLVRKLVELHDGTVEAHSEGIGKGSEFVIRLPALREAPHAPLSESTTPGSARSVNPLRLLVVDDNVDAAESMSLVLTMSGHQVHQAHTGEEALQAAKEYRPDAILMDIGLPGLNGYQVAERLRETPDLRDIVLIAMTGYGQEDDRQRAKQVGFDYHLVKPADPQQLQQLLAALGKKQNAA
jgi:PAS domain S-box-containing protein